MSNETRQPAGVPVGGQFATNPKAETGVALLDGGRLADIRDAGDLVNRAYDQMTDSDLLDSLRADSDTGEELDYPHAEHADAVRAVRRYRDVLAGMANGGPGERVLVQPLSKSEAFDRAGQDGFLTVTVSADVGQMIDAGYGNDDYTVDDYLANLAVKGQIPYDSSYRVAGVDGEGNLLVDFTTGIGGEMDAQHGQGMFEACKDGTEYALCADCEEPYGLAEGHDCAAGGLSGDEEQRLAELETAFEHAGGRGVDLANEIDALRAKRDGVGPSGTCRACNVADHDTCPGVDGCSCCHDTLSGTY